MNIEELQKKVQASEERIEKINNTIEKHKKAGEKKITALNKIFAENGLAVTYDDVCEKKGWFYDYQDEPFYHELYWTACDIRDKESSINDNLKKLKAANETLKNWQEKLRLEQVKMQYIQDSIPDVIKEFLELWKQQVLVYYNNKAESYPEDYKIYRAEKHKLYFDLLVETAERLDSQNHEEFVDKYCWRNEDCYKRAMETLHDEYKPDQYYGDVLRHAQIERNPKYVRFEDEFKSKYGEAFFNAWMSNNFAAEWIDKQLEQEKNNKLIDLMTRVSKVTGEITDASYLTIKEGNLNGYIIGVDGSADVETIGAGGYNIQCFHFRTLVKPRNK